MTDESGPNPELVDLAAGIVELLDRGEQEGALALARSLHPADLADAIGGLDTDIRELVAANFEPDELAAVLEYLDPHYRGLLLEEMEPAEVAEVVSEVSDDIAVDALQDLTGAEAAEVVVALPQPARESIGKLVGYAPDSAAGRMTGRLLTVESDEAVGDVIESLRATRTDTAIPALYAVDADERLVGVVPVRNLLIAEPDTPVGAIAEDVVTVTADTDQEQALGLLKLYNIPALPVVDDEGRVLGTLTADDLLDVLDEEVTEDMFRLAGVDPEEDLESVARSVRYRLPWLYANLATVILAAYVVSRFEATLAQVAILAAFLPVVGGQGGNAGLQTVTVVVRSLALGHLAPRNTPHVVRHELAVGITTGLASALAVAPLAWVWHGNLWLASLVFVAILGNVVIGVVAGVLIPMALHTMNQDPALSAGIWLTTVTDVAGFLLFLGLGTMIIAHL